MRFTTSMVRSPDEVADVIEEPIGSRQGRVTRQVEGHVPLAL